MSAPSRRQQFMDLSLLGLVILLFNLSFPGGSQPWLAWCVLVPLGVAIHGKKSLYTFRLTVYCGLLCWLLATWWVIPGVSRVASSSPLIVIPFTLLFCLAYALPYAVAATFYSRFKWTQTISGALKGAVVWTAICYLVPHILPGNLAHSQYLYPRIIQAVELAGVPLLFFLLHCTNFLLVVTAINWASRRRYALQAGVFALLIPVSLLTYGHWRLADLQALTSISEFPQVQVGLVQPNVSIRSRERADWQREAGQLIALTESLLGSDPALDLIVWPEIPPPLSYVQQQEDRELLRPLLAENRVPLLIAGYQTHSADPAAGYFNVAEYISGSGEAQTYRKQHLLPFGEYLPYEKQFPWLRNLFPNALSYLPGTEAVPFQLNDAIRLMPLICYEAVFPELVANGLAQQGNLIINPVDDAWFGKSKAAEIHLALALFRTVEFRLPFVRASNSGRSLLITASGEIVPETQIGLFQTGVASGSLALIDFETPYQRFGNWFLWPIGVLALWFVGCALVSDSRKQPGV